MNYEDELDKRINIFDFLALEIIHLKNLDKKAFDNRSYRDSLKQPASCKKAVNEFFRSHSSLENTKNLLRYGILEKEYNELKEWENYCSFFHIFELIMEITRRLDCDLLLKTAAIRHISQKGFEALNSNATETGLLILPRVKTINDSSTPYEEDDVKFKLDKKKGNNHKKWADHHFNGINMDLANIYYIETSLLFDGEKRIRIQNFVITDSNFVNRKKPLRVGLSPIAYANLLNHQEYCKSEDGKELGLFSITGIKDEELVKHRFEAAFRSACEQQVDILIYPEMLGFEQICSNEYFFNLRQQLLKDNLRAPSIIALPTWWHDNTNELKIVDGSGRQICKQNKIEPFPFTVKGETYLEDIKSNEPVINIIHIQNFGRLIFPICRDILSPNYRNIAVQVLKATFLICPSYSQSSTLFDYTASEPICYGCYTIWLNTCAAGFDESKHFSHIGLVSGPQMNGKSSTLLCPKCEEKCGNKDDTCLFVADIRVDISADISYYHIKPNV